MGKWVLAGFLTASLTMCGKNNSDSASLTGRASLGPISAAAVIALAVNADGSEGQTIAQTTTDAEGNFSLTVPPSPNPIELVVTGGNYVEESGKATVQVGSQKLHAFVVSAQGKIDTGVDSVTEMVYRRAKGLVAEGKSADISIAIQTAMNETASATGLADVSVSADDPNRPQDPDGSAGKKALFLCGISKQAVSNGRTSLDESLALAQDFEDGKFDGKDDSNATISFSGQSSGTLSSNELQLVGAAQVAFTSSSDNTGGFNASDAAQVSLNQ